MQPNAEKPAIFHKCLNVSHTGLMAHFAEVLAFNLMRVRLRISYNSTHSISAFLVFQLCLCPSQLFSVTSERLLEERPSQTSKNAEAVRKKMVHNILTCPCCKV